MCEDDLAALRGGRATLYATCQAAVLQPPQGQALQSPGSGFGLRQQRWQHRQQQ